jgi:hypothetical protein
MGVKCSLLGCNFRMADSSGRMPTRGVLAVTRTSLYLRQTAVTASKRKCWCDHLALLNQPVLRC